MESCAIIETLPEVPAHDLPEFAMVTRVLRPLTWLGGLGSRKPKRHSGWGFDKDFRKVPLFEQLAQFQVELKETEGVLH